MQNKYRKRSNKLHNRVMGHNTPTELEVLKAVAIS